MKPNTEIRTKTQVRMAVTGLAGCACQGPRPGWPCGSCFDGANLDPDNHGLWQSLLAYRGDYHLNEHGTAPTDINQSREVYERNIQELKTRLQSRMEEA